MTRRIPGFDDFQIIILNPPAASTGISVGEIGSDGNLIANGTLSYNEARSLGTVWGVLNSTVYTGTVGSNGRDWTIPGIPGTALGGTNVLNVGGTFTNGDYATPCLRTFAGPGGGSGSGGSGKLAAGPASADHKLLPRFYRVVLDSKTLNLFERGEEMLLGGLLQRTPVYLAYDPIQSLPDAPVWRDINLPPPAGSWTLRVTSSGSRATARLVLTRLSDVHVLPPLIWTSDDWCPRQPNAMCSTEVSPSGSALQIWVEPA